MNAKQLATLKNAYDRRKELLEFQKSLKENPMQESEYLALIDESNLNLQDKVKYREHIKTLRKNKMIIDDIPEAYKDFSKRVESDGFVPIKKSIMKQMTAKEFQKLTSKQIAIYDDINGAEKVIHYEYNGKKTGDGISVVHHKTNNPEVVKKAENSYKSARDVITKTLTEIDVNGSKYQDYRVDKD